VLKGRRPTISRHASKRCSAAPKIDERGGLRRAGGGLVAWNRSETASSDVNQHKVRKIKKKQSKENKSLVLNNESDEERRGSWSTK